MILKGTGWNSGPGGQRLNNGAMEVYDQNARDADPIPCMLRVAGGLQRAAGFTQIIQILSAAGAHE
jgi:hypothetical protein